MQDCLALIEALDNAGINYWVDRQGIEAGSAWAQIIGKALHESSIVLLLASEYSLNSDNVFNEIDLAVSMNKPIVPVVIGNFPDGYYKLMYHVHARQRLEHQSDEQFSGVIAYLRNKLQVNTNLASATDNTCKQDTSTQDIVGLRESLANINRGKVDVDSISLESKNTLCSRVGEGRKKRTKLTHKYPDGAVVFLPHRGVWVGYAEGRIVCTKNSSDKVVQFLMQRYSLTGVINVSPDCAA